jgi:hypothetical protein
VGTDASSSESGQRKLKMARFEGFASWERLLQDWTDDIQDYMDTIEAENTEYPFSTHGIPANKLASSHDESSSKSDSGVKDDAVNGSPTKDSLKKLKDIIMAAKNPPSKKKPISLPVPAPAKDGEEILPHTDIADRSKHIWIVTTAALPWLTGTAVNPLLRAAYMTEGRSEAGGSVTLMLPWLERRQDQVSLYGESRVFDTPEQQASHIRTWLREKAKLPEASEKLRIEWYTAWESKHENSVYSMGDITALIPAEQVDICILEEPEHLNW